jgi:outer membrane protein assembly factor BamB
VDAKERLVLAGAQGMAMNLPLKALPAGDRDALARAVVDPRMPDGAALVAFYCLLDGRTKEARPFLEVAGDRGADLAGLFALGVAPAPGAGPAPAPALPAVKPPPPPPPSPATGTPERPYGFRRDGSGWFPDATPPLKWGPGDGLAWECQLPGEGNSSPALGGGLVFVTCAPHRLVAVSMATGTIAWDVDNSFAAALNDAARDADLPKPEWGGFIGYCTPTPVTDGRHVWAVFGHGVATCFTIDGKRVWATAFDAKNRVSGPTASPVLVDGLLVFPTKERPRMLALDAVTGQRRWSTDGDGDGTPRVIEVDGRRQLAFASGQLADLAGGELRNGLLGGGFRQETDDRASNWGPTPAVGDGRIYYHVHFKKSGMCNGAIRAVDPATGQQVWENYISAEGNIRQRMGRSHLYHDGLVYAINDAGLLFVIDARDGSTVYQQDDLGGRGYVSLSLAGQHLYHFSAGRCVVFAPGRTYQERERFDPGFGAGRESKVHIASPAFAGKNLFFRGRDSLWCVGPAPAP